MADIAVGCNSIDHGVWGLNLESVVTRKFVHLWALCMGTFLFRSLWGFPLGFLCVYS
jgi:hypothetical protein